MDQLYIMSIRMLKALGGDIGELTEIEVFVSAFPREILKTLRTLPIDLTMDSMTSLFASFIINYMTNYYVLLRRD